MSLVSPRPTRSRDPADRSQRPRRFELLQVVHLQDALPGLGFVKGECGTVVEILPRPHRAYLVEFVDDDGQTRAEAILLPEQLSATPPPPCPIHERP